MSKTQSFGAFILENEEGILEHLQEDWYNNVAKERSWIETAGGQIVGNDNFSSNIRDAEQQYMQDILESLRPNDKKGVKAIIGDDNINVLAKLYMDAGLVSGFNAGKIQVRAFSEDIKQEVIKYAEDELDFVGKIPPTYVR